MLIKNEDFKSYMYAFT